MRHILKGVVYLIILAVPLFFIYLTILKPENWPLYLLINPFFWVFGMLSLRVLGIKKDEDDHGQLRPASNQADRLPDNFNNIKQGRTVVVFTVDGKRYEGPFRKYDGSSITILALKEDNERVAIVTRLDLRNVKSINYGG